MTISKEQLAELTELVNERIAEWEFLETMSIGSRLSRGVVRLVFDVIDEWHNEQCWQQDEQEATVEIDPLPAPRVIIRDSNTTSLRIEPPVTASNGNGVTLSESAVATLGPEHTVVTPVPPEASPEVAEGSLEGRSVGLVPRRPRTLGEADEILDLAQGSELKAALLREILGELQVMSKGGEMPSMVEYDERRPLHLGNARAITVRYKLTWARLAECANLRFDLTERKARRHGITE